MEDEFVFVTLFNCEKMKVELFYCCPLWKDNLLIVSKKNFFD